MLKSPHSREALEVIILLSSLESGGEDSDMAALAPTLRHPSFSYQLLRSERSVGHFKVRAVFHSSISFAHNPSHLQVEEPLSQAQVSSSVCRVVGGGHRLLTRGGVKMLHTNATANVSISSPQSPLKCTHPLRNHCNTCLHGIAVQAVFVAATLTWHPELCFCIYLDPIVLHLHRKLSVRVSQQTPAYFSKPASTKI